MNTDLIIVGGGAAGLMAGNAAGAAGLRAVIVERRHRPGLKLLLCGNNRCNVTHQADAEAMLTAYGDPVGAFLRPAVLRFPPAALRRWFASSGLSTTVHDDDRVFPRSGKADDVVHCFTDGLRNHGIPLILNCPVQSISRARDGQFHVHSERLVLSSPHVLLATGGVSYPKTGSVGDGQLFAKALGHRIEPYRPGLAGIELGVPWLQRGEDISLPDSCVRIRVNGHTVAESPGEILCSKQCARGPAMVNASRIMARHGYRDPDLEIDLFARFSAEQLGKRLLRSWRQAGGNWIDALAMHLPDRRFAEDFFVHVIGPSQQGEARVPGIARALKHWGIHPVKVRPLKEAMVTVGGVILDEIKAETMASRKCDGLWFAGEVMDVDGPTGGYNLHAAFATARLAVASVATAYGLAIPSSSPARPSRPSRRSTPRPRPPPKTRSPALMAEQS